MRCVIQKVTHAQVVVEGEVVGKIADGFMVLVGAENGDTEADARYCADKIAGLRVFEDENDKMNLSLADVGGSVLLVSQFTLLADARHGRRPDFIQAARPEAAEPLCARVTQMIEEKIEQVIADSCTEEFQDAIEWAFDQKEDVTPFMKEGYVDSYYKEAQEKYDESQALLEEGKQDNKNGDTYNLVTVIYSLVLFLLGIVGIFKNIPNRFAVFVIAVVLMIAATVFMFTIPMPTGFSLGSYF